MRNSSAIVQRVMEDILRGISGVIIYQDDILITAASSYELAKRVTNVQRRLEQRNVTLNLQKSILLAKEVRFLGDLINKDGVKPDPAIAEKITSCKHPRDKAELESFLGLVNFFGRMLPNCAATVRPLHDLRRKGTTFAWLPHHQAAFDKLLGQMSTPPTLQSYQLDEEATLTTDASECAIAGILTQSGKPIMYVSRSLTSAERNYNNVEREALAVVWSTLRLKQFLLGRNLRSSPIISH